MGVTKGLTAPIGAAGEGMYRNILDEVADGSIAALIFRSAIKLL